MAKMHISFRANKEDASIIREAQTKKGVQAIAEILRMALRALRTEMNKETK